MEIKVPYAENPEVSAVTPGVGQNIALCTLPTVRASVFQLSSFNFIFLFEVMCQ